MHGIININKPPGFTSHDVVARVRRITGQKKAGHAGTLDPLATGVLPVVLGKATRLVEYLADADKAYRATIVLGATSDTYDREGAITATSDAVMPLFQEVEAALEAFRGEIEQLPPMHSAIKVGGKKLYELARSGTEIERKPRRVTISTLHLEDYDPPSLSIFVECSKGTYIRSLAYDLGAALCTGAYLDELVRTRHGPFTIERAITLEELNERIQKGSGENYLHLPEYILQGWQTYTTTREQERDIIQGKPIQLSPPENGDRPLLAAKTSAGDLLAVLYWRSDKGCWQPKKVFKIEDCSL